MSKSRLASALVLGTLLAATTLAGLPGVAHAQATDASTGKQAARRPPTQTPGRGGLAPAPSRDQPADRRR
jgi:hypothetical protein